MSNQDYADTSPQLVALFERSAYLTAPVQAQVLQISFMASSMAIREFLGDFTQSQFLAIPNRFRWITVRALAAICVFSVLTLVSFTLNVSALALTTNLADILQPEALNQMVWILLHQVVAIALCGLIAFSAGMLLMSTGATLTFVSSLFILIPSVLQSLSDGFRLSGQQVLSNLWTMFPVGFQAVRWLPEHSFMPQFLITGQLLISPSQELLIMSFWAVLITSLAFVRVTTKSLRRDSL